jgi:hypothetical protein
MVFCFKSGKDYYTGLMKKELCSGSAVLFLNPLFSNLHFSGQHARQSSLSGILQPLCNLSKLIREIVLATAISRWQKASLSRLSNHNSSLKITQHVRSF